MRRDIEQKLRAHQVEPFKQLLGILASHQSAVDLSDTGTGKTYVAAAIAAANKLPTLVVCPKIVVSAWRRAAEHFGDELSVINYEMLQTGRSPFGSWAKSPQGILRRKDYYVCQCCQRKVIFEDFSPCYCHPNGIHCIDTKKSPQSLGNFIYHESVKQIVFDEVHRCGALDSLNADMLIAAKRQNIKVLGLSATAACNPLNMRALGYNLDLHGDKADRFAPNMGQTVRPAGISYERYANNFILPNFYRWASRYGCRRDPAFHGFKWLVGADKQVEVMRDIRSSIIPARGVRVTTESIPDFPERQIDFEEYDVTNPEKIEALYQSIAEPMSALQQKKTTDTESALTKILRARQEIELLKTEIFSELTSDFVEKGFSVALFLNFRASIRHLEKKLACHDVIDGENTDSERQAAIDRFQEDKTRIILVQTAAGSEGLSLHDIRGKFPRVGLISPSFSVRELIQAAGRLHRSGGRSKCFYRVIFAASTVESRVARALQQKGNNLAALNDGDLMLTK